MKKRFLLLICSLILISCSSIPKAEAAKAETIEVSSSESKSIESASSRAKEVEFAHYPEDFLTMEALQGTDDHDYSDPFIYAVGEGANGEFRIAYYDNYDTFEMGVYEMGIVTRWAATQIVYKNKNYITSEGISVGSEKKDVIDAYEKYGIEEYNLSKITDMGLDSLDIVLKGIDLSNTFLYIDNHNIFNESYTGVDYWGGLGAYIFILDSNNYVAKIVSCAPTSG